MTDLPTGDAGNQAESRSAFRTLAVLAALSACVYGVISLRSWQFDFYSVTADRPIVAVLALFATAFAGYLGAIRLARRLPSSRRLEMLIVSTAIVFRVVMLFSLPIQEVDIYRYLWDGSVSTARVSPFLYSPEQVRSADRGAVRDPRLHRLVERRDRHPALAEILNRVHFAELPTIYPPTSQAVFAAASLMTPSDAALLTRLFIMKAWFIGFDIATLFVVIALLRLSEKPVGLCVIYAWCPLLMKEVANSGHLDAVAVFVTTLAIYMLAKVLTRQRKNTVLVAESLQNSEPRESHRTISLGGPDFRAFHLSIVAFCLALAVGAKLYPIVLSLLFALLVLRRLGWRAILVPIAVFALSTAILLSPMTPSAKPAGDPSRGVVTFLRHWEMNDFLFLIVIENVKPTAGLDSHEIAWFSIVPESARQSVVNLVSTRFHIPPDQTPFLVTRALTAIIFVTVAFQIAWRTARPEHISRFFEGAFLTLAWFWLLCPTQNPWYWTWALPLLPFARNRAWLAVSGLVLLYYLRFWLSYHYAETAVLGTPYTGTTFYDLVVTWVEFAPWFLCLIFGYVIHRKNVDSDGISNQSMTCTGSNPDAPV